MVVIGLNLLARRRWPRAVVEPGALLTVRVVVALASPMAGHDRIEVLVPVVTHRHDFFRPENARART